MATLEQNVTLFVEKVTELVAGGVGANLALQNQQRRMQSYMLKRQLMSLGYSEADTDQLLADWAQDRDSTVPLLFPSAASGQSPQLDI